MLKTGSYCEESSVTGEVLAGNAAVACGDSFFAKTCSEFGVLENMQRYSQYMLDDGSQQEQPHGRPHLPTLAPLVTYDALKRRMGAPTFTGSLACLLEREAAAELQRLASLSQAMLHGVPLRSSTLRESSTAKAIRSG